MNENNMANEETYMPRASKPAQPLDAAVETVQAITKKVKRLPKKLLIAAGAAVVAIILLIVIISALSNTYTTPVKYAQDAANAKKFSQTISLTTKQLNGFCQDEFETIVGIMLDSEEYSDMMEDAEDEYAEMIEDRQDDYGSNYKYTYKVAEKEKLEKSDLRDLRDQLRDIADIIEELDEEVDDFDSDDWEDLSDEIGVSKSQAKKMVNAILSMGKAMKTAKVSEGYELEVEIILTGRELDEPEEDDTIMYVYKVNGRWISAEALRALRSMLYNFY